MSTEIWSELIRGRPLSELGVSRVAGRFDLRTEHRRQERDLFELEQALLRPEAIPDVVATLRRRSEIDARDFLPIVDGMHV